MKCPFCNEHMELIKRVENADDAAGYAFNIYQCDNKIDHGHYCGSTHRYDIKRSLMFSLDRNGSLIVTPDPTCVAFNRKIRSMNVDRFVKTIGNVDSTGPMDGRPEIIAVKEFRGAPEQRYLLFATRTGHILIAEDMSRGLSSSWVGLWHYDNFEETFMDVVSLGFPTIKLIELLDLSTTDLTKAKSEFDLFYLAARPDLDKIINTLGGV